MESIKMKIIAVIKQINRNIKHLKKIMNQCNQHQSNQ